MKHILSCLFIFCAFTSHAQVNRNPHPSQPVVFYLDSVMMTQKFLFDPDKIKSIDVVKENDANKKTSGKIYITSKNPGNYNFLTLEQIAKQNVPAATNCIFMIDNELIKDTSDIRIDSSYILRRQVTSTKEIKYLQNQPELTILNIIIRTKENLDKDKHNYIRGMESVLRKE